LTGAGFVTFVDSVKFRVHDSWIILITVVGAEIVFSKSVIYVKIFL